MQSNDEKEAKDFLMECKCLFLRTRTPSKSVLQFIIEKIWPQYTYNTSQSTSALTKAHNNFDSWRNNLNRELKKTAELFIKQKGQVLGYRYIIFFISSSTYKFL